MATQDVEVELQEVLINTSAADPGPSGRTLEHVLKDLEKALQLDNNDDVVNQYLPEMVKLLQDDNTVGAQPAASSALCYAARVGSIPMMDTLIQKGVDVNTKSRIYIDEQFGYEAAPLHVAAYRDNVETITFLVDKGADVNIKDNRERTPICWAAYMAKFDAVRCLCEKGADVDIKNQWGNTPLCGAVHNGNIEVVRYLGDKPGVDINNKNNNGRTPLHIATEHHREEVIEKYLVDHGADVNTKDNDGNTPLHLASQRGYLDTVTYLVGKGADVNIRNYLGRTPLHKAAERGKVAVVRYFVDKGADVDIKDRDGRAPLHEAAESGMVDMVRYFVDKGADVNIKDNNGRTPLHKAAERGKVDVVRYFVDKGADVDIKDRDGYTPLSLAAFYDKFDTVKYLVEKGADVNIQCYEKETPLHFACIYENAEAVKYLLEKGADPTKGAWNSLSRAISSKRKDIATLLLGHDKWEEMLRYSSEGTPLMRELITFMPDVAEVAFNKCVTTNENKKHHMDSEVVVHPTSDTFQVKFNYEFLEDFQYKHSSDSNAKSWCPKKFTKHHHPLNLIRKHDRSNLLKHPLVISLLEYKWTRFGQFIFFGNLFIYLIFLAFLTAFGLVVLSPLEKTCVDVLNGSFNGTAPENCEGLSIHEYHFLYVGAAVTILTALFRLATEIFQLCRHPLEYLLDWVNWLEIPLYLFSIIFTFVFATPCLCVHSWQWQIGVVAVYLGWVGLITFLQKWPVTGVYVLMFVNILGSFMKIAFLALLLVIAFGLAFYMLLFEPDEMRTAFSHPGRAIVKVMAMTTGELDYDDLYHQQEGEDEIAFPPVSFLLWIIFLVLMPVLLSNLLVGLAVGDVDRLQKTANENRIGLQIDLVLSFEELLDSLGIRHRFAIKLSKTCYPNVPATLLPEWCKKGSTNVELVCSPEDHKLLTRMGRWYSKLWITNEYSTSGVKISHAIKPPPESLENQLQMQCHHLEAKLQKQDGHLESELKEQSEKLEAKLSKRSEHQSQHLETQLKEQSEQFQEAVRQLSECHKEQAKKMEEKTEQLAGEVASLREALEKLVTHMATK